MDAITLPPPEELRQRIASCEQELKSLRRLMRASRDLYDAEEARRSRPGHPGASAGEEATSASR